MNFMFLDILLMLLFLGFISYFLIKNKKKIKKEGLLWLYHTSWGIKLIEKVGKKYQKTLKFLSWVSVTIGYALMAGMIYLFGKIVYIYVFHADIVQAVKLPPIMPLVPYLPQMFQLSWLPPFYFSYWIIILAIIAITHEFFHGIFASLNGVKTKTTGFGFFPFFFPIFLAAFVNLDEKIMAKKSSFKQRAVLSAGTFANILTAIIGVILMFGFFSLSFSPAGVIYDDYAYKIVQPSEIESINGVPIDSENLNYSELQNISIFNEIIVGDENFVAVKGFTQDGSVALYYDAPAIRSEMNGPLTQINGKEITSLESLSTELRNYNPGETISIQYYNGTYQNQSITLSESPEGNPWFGITFLDKDQSGGIARLSNLMTSYKNSSVFYAPKFEAAKFIYDLLWWLVLISFSVALVNMLPMGIFDGGRFFYLTVLSLTKSEKAAKNSFKYLTLILLFAVFLLMFYWAKNLF